jgi:hypothetical protein
MSSFLKKRKINVFWDIRIFFLKYILRFNNGLKKKFKRGQADK